MKRTYLAPLQGGGGGGGGGGGEGEDGEGTNTQNLQKERANHSIFSQS